MECNGGENQICRVKFQLLASFFEEDEPPRLNVGGTVALRLKTRRRHLDEIAVNGLLHHDNNINEKRKLPKGKDEDRSTFELEVEVRKQADSASIKKRVHMMFYAALYIVGGVYAF